MNNSEMDVLSFFEAEREGEEDVSDHTPRTEDTGETESASVAGEQANTSREKAFRALMEGEYKDLFTAYFQQTFNRRFKEHKEIKTELESARAVLDAVKERYGELSGEELLDAIRAETVSKNAPTEAKNALPEKDEATSALDAQRVYAEAEARVLAHIRARGLRPAENGVSKNYTCVNVTGALTRKERAEIARRAVNGERIEL